MSRSIDERVATMRFDNRQFQAGVEQTLKDVERLNKGLKFDGASKGLEEVNEEVKKLNAHGLDKSIEVVVQRMQTLGVVAQTIIQRLTNALVDFGKKTVDAFAIEPVTTGFNEYELKMGSVQTIMAATGESVGVVNKYLDELNEYSDRTIYSFADMTNNIGKFTNAGVSLKDSVAAIKGISNEAALAGANANEASRAMYNFAQALSSGSVKLIDWKSIENANMATVQFKDELLKTAAEMGTVKQDANGMYQVLTKNAGGASMKTVMNATRNFNDSLSYQWMTSEVLIETLKKYSDETTQIGKDAYAAAQDVKTFSMMVETLKEAAQSGWAETWQLIIGDFEEAKKTWTTFTEFFSDIISQSAKARNELLGNAMRLQNDDGITGREALWQSLLNILEAVRSVIGAVKEAWEEIFPPITDQRLRGIIESFKIFTERLKANEELLGKIKRTFKGIFAVLDIFVTLMRVVFHIGVNVVKELLSALQTLFFAGFGMLMNWIERVKTAETGFNGWVNGIIKGVKKFVEYVTHLDGLTLTNVLKTIASFATNVIGSVFNFDAIVSVFSEVSDKINQFFTKLAGSTGQATTKLGGVLDRFIDWLIKAKDKIVEIFQSLAKKITIDKIIGVAIGVGLTLIIFNFNKFIKSMTEVFGAIKEVFSGIGDVISATAKKIKANATAKLMLAFSASILMLVGSLAVLVMLTSDKQRFFTALAVLAALIAGIAAAMFALGKVDSKKSVGFAAVIVAFGLAMGSLASALSTIQSIANERILASLGVLTVILAELLAVGILIGSTKKQYTVGATVLLGFAWSLSIIVDVLAKIDGTELQNTKTSLTLLLQIVGILAVLGVAFKNVKIGAALTMLAGVFLVSQIVKAMQTFSEIDVESIKKALLAIGGVFAIFAGLMIVARAVTVTLDELSVISGQGVKLGFKANDTLKQLGSVMLSIAISLGIVALTIKMIGSLDQSDIDKALKFIGGVSLAFVAVIAVSILAGDNADKAGSMLTKMASAILKLSIVIVALSWLTNPEDLDGPVKVITKLMVVMSLLVAVTIFVPDTEMVVKVFKALSTAVAILAIVVVALSFLPNEDGLKRATAIITALMAVFALLVASTSLVKKATSTLLILNATLVVMTSLLIILSEMHIENTISNATALGIMIVSLAASMALIGRLSNSIDQHTILNVLEMAGIMAALNLVIGYLESRSGFQVSIQNATALSVLMLALAAAIKVMNGVKIEAETALMMVGMSAMILLIMAILAGLNSENAEVKLGIETAVSLSALLLALGAAIKIANGVKIEAETALMMVGMSAMILLIMAILAGLNSENAEVKLGIETALSLSVLLLALSAAIKIANGVKIEAEAALTMVAMAGLILLIMAILAGLNSENAEIKLGIETALSLSVLLIAMGAAIKIANGVKIEGAVIGTIAVMGLIVGGILAVIALLAGDSGEIKLSIETATSLSVLLLAMSAATLIASKVGPVAGFAMAGAIAIAAFIVVMGALMWGIGALARANPSILEDLEFTIQVFEKMGEAFGASLGGFIKGVSENMDLSIFEKVGNDIAAMLEAIKPAIQSFDDINAENFDKLKALMAAILMITASDAIEGMTKFWKGESSIEKFAEQLDTLGGGLVDFTKSTEDISLGDHVDGALKLLRDIIELAKTIPNQGGILSGIVGDNDLKTFSNQFTYVGWGIRNFVTAVNNAEFNKGQIDNAMYVMEKLVAVAKEIPNSGGWLGKIVGNNDLDMFAGQFGAVADGVNAFCTGLNGMQYIKNTVEFAIEIVRKLALVAQDIPNEGFSWVSVWVGDNRIEDFAEQFPKVGEGIAAFCASVYSMYFNKERTESALKVVETLARIANDIPNQGISWVSMWVGDNKIQDFAVQFPYVGWGIASFCSYIHDHVKSGDDEKAETALQVFQKIVEHSKDLDKLKFNRIDLVEFGAQISVLGQDLSYYAGWIAKIQDMDSVEKATKIVESLADLLVEVDKLDFGRFKDFGHAIQEFALTSLADFVKVFEDADTTKIGTTLSKGITESIHKTQGRFVEEGKYLVTGFINGVTIKMNDQNGVKAAGQALASTFLQGLYEGLDENSPSARTAWAGEMAILGFVEGLKTDKYSVADAGVRMGDELMDAAQNRLGIHSRSTEGHWLGQEWCHGFADGIKDFGEMVTNAATNVSNGVINIGLQGKEQWEKLVGGTGVWDMSASLGDNLVNARDWVKGWAAGFLPEPIKFDFGQSVTEAIEEELNKTMSSVGDTFADIADGSSTKKSASDIAEAMKLELHKHFDSKEFIYLGEQIGEEMAIATNNAIVSKVKAASPMADEIIAITEEGLDKWKAWVETRKTYDQLAQTDELAGWVRIQQKYLEGTKERMEADQAVYNLQKELVKGTYEYSKKWIDNEKYYERLSLEEELAAWERIQARYMEGSEQRIEAEKEVYRIKKELRQKDYEDQKKWIEREKKFERLSLADELAAYLRIRKTTTEGSDERLEMDEKVYDLQKQIYEAEQQYIKDVADTQKEAAEERVRLEQEYADKVKSINEKLASDIAQLNENYANQVDQRKKSLYSAYGLFDAVEQQDFDKDELMRNLEDQVRAFEEWQMTINNLAARGLDKALIDELTEMGPSAAGQIRALNDMTDAELGQYNLLWSEKSMLAREQAVSELEELRIQTSENIAQLQQDSAKELDEYRKTWAENMAKITSDCEEKLAQLKKNFGETVGTIKKDTDAKLREITETANRILREAGWSETGEQIVNGIVNGMNKNKTKVALAAGAIATLAVAALNSKLKIKSPSKVTEETGEYVGEGFIRGIESYYDRVWESGRNLGEELQNGAFEAIKYVNNLLEDGMDSSVTITPVFDLTNVRSGIGDMQSMLDTSKAVNLATSANLSLDQSRDFSFINPNEKVVQELQNMRKDLGKLGEQVASMQLVMDTGAIVGEITTPLDAALGSRIVRNTRERG